MQLFECQVLPPFHSSWVLNAAISSDQKSPAKLYSEERASIPPDTFLTFNAVAMIWQSPSSPNLCPTIPYIWRSSNTCVFFLICPSRKFTLFESYTCAFGIALKFLSYGTVSDLFYSITIIFHLVATACPSLLSSRDLSESFTSRQQQIGQTICKKKKG